MNNYFILNKINIIKFSIYIRYKSTKLLRKMLLHLKIIIKNELNMIVIKIQYYLFNINILFDGNYKEGKRWNDNGNIDSKFFEYQLKERNRKVKEYCFNNEKIYSYFDGNYINEEKNGKIPDFFP